MFRPKKFESEHRRQVIHAARDLGVLSFFCFSARFVQRVDDLLAIHIIDFVCSLKRRNHSAEYELNRLQIYFFPQPRSILQPPVAMIRRRGKAIARPCSESVQADFSKPLVQFGHAA
jgi:hypothetical protein